MLGPGQVEISAYTVGMNLGMGLAENFDLNVSLTNNGNINDNLQLNIVTLAPKFSLIKDKTAIYIPVSRISADDITIIQPTLLITNPVSKNIDFTFAPKSIITINNLHQLNVMYGLSDNFSIHLPKTPFSIRTALGFVYSQQTLNNRHFFIDANIGLVFNLNQ